MSPLRIDGNSLDAAFGQLAAAIEATNAGMVLCDRALPDMPIVYANEAFCRITGYALHEVLGHNCRFLQGPTTDAAAVTTIRERIGAGRAVEIELLNYRKDGTAFWNALSITAVPDGFDLPRYLIGVQQDVTARVTAVRDLRRREALLAQTERITGSGGWELDIATQEIYWSEQVYRIHELEPGDRPEIDRALSFYPAEARAVLEQALARLADGTSYDLELPFITARGRHRWVRTTGASEHDGDRAIRLFGIIQDITQRKEAEQALRESESQARHLAQHDSLTGLPNRRLFQDRLEQAVAQAIRYGEQVGLLLLDLDDFKEINDRFGHDVGDRLLIDVASRLNGCLRSSDTLARLGGDEFAVILPRLCGPAGAMKVAEQIGAALNEPMIHGDKQIDLCVSIGIALFPEDGQDTGDLLKNADIVLYRAKAEGGHRHCFFASEMRVQREQRKQLEEELRHALAHDEIVPFYQPKVRLEDRSVVGFEALVRWQHPERGLIPPADFLPAAEQAGLITELDEVVLRQVVTQLALWKQEGLPIGYVAVNLAGPQLRCSGLAGMISTLLTAYELKPQQLMIEVTEGVFLGRGIDQVAEELRALHTLGIAIALDDFGTGYASLTHLQRLPIDVLKIDQSFVRDMLDNPGNAAIAHAVLSLGHSLGMKVTAEGIESEEQVDWLQRHGCDFGQGYLFGHPMPARAVTAWLCRRFEV